MELWIRSQDRERLGKIVYLELRNDDYGFYIMGWRDKFEGTRIATYKTKERALEVLNEIQDLLVPKLQHVCDRDLEGNEVKVLGIDYIQSIVYEMPDE